MFLRNKKKIKENPLQDKVAGKIASGFIKVQILFSNGMNKIFANMNIKKLKFLLFGFCLLSGGFSIYLLVNAVVSKPAHAIRIDTVKVPEHFNKSGEEFIKNIISDEVYGQIQEYKKHMDSLGLPIRQSLLDSMKMLEGIYAEQQRLK